MENISNKLYCEKCKCETLHEIHCKYEKTDYNNDEHDLEDKSIYYIVRCIECDNVSFLKSTQFFDAGEKIDSNYEIYPQVDPDINIISIDEHIPDQIKPIYDETKIAFNNKAYRLSSIGLRAIIESICIYYDVKKGIKKLQGNVKPILANYLVFMKNDGIISKKDYESLDLIRKYGNDSAHDMEPMARDKQIMAFKIINNILENMFIKFEYEKRENNNSNIYL